MSRGIFDKLPLLNEPIPIVPWLLPMARETRAQTKNCHSHHVFGTGHIFRPPSSDPEPAALLRKKTSYPHIQLTLCVVWHDIRIELV